MDVSVYFQMANLQMTKILIDTIISSDLDGKLKADSTELLKEAQEIYKLYVAEDEALAELKAQPIERKEQPSVKKRLWRWND